MEIRRFLIWGILCCFSGLGTCKQCPSSDNESVFVRNKAYTYRYRSEALSQAVGTTEDHGKIALECDVRVRHQRDCVYFLDLESCLATAAGGRPESQTAWIDRQPLPDLSKYPISFSLESGRINVVKFHDEDPLHFVNIKKGVLSAFVFKLSQAEREIQESHTDIHGVCPLTSVPDEKLSVVRTSKDMLHCNYPSRRDWQFSPWSLFWNMSFIQHVINSTTDCVYNIDREERRIEGVSCKERHAIMLESTHRTTTAVQTNIDYFLNFVKSEDIQASKTSFPVLNRKTGIQYEYEDTPVPQSSPANFLPVAEKMLADLVLDSVDEIRLFTIPQFTDFVAWLRTSHDLAPFVERVRSCAFLPDCDPKIKDLAFSYLSDALLQCNSLPCMRAVTDLAAKDDLSQTYLNNVYVSWSFMHYSKPGFISSFAEMCKLKNSQQCWMSLGSYIQRIYSRDGSVDDKVYQEAKEVADIFYSRIREECEVTEDTAKTYTDCLAFLKAANNMGRYFAKLQPQGINQLLELSTNEHLPVVVRMSALEALQDVSDPENREERLSIYDHLVPLFRNESLAASVRILSYDLLVGASEDRPFEEHLLAELREGRNDEVKYYVADSLDKLTTDLEFRAKRGKFLSTLKELLRENNLTLEWILYETTGQSKTGSRNVFLNLPFLPDYMKRFGMKIRDSFVYDSYIYPTIFKQSTIFQLFGTVLPETKLGAYFEGFEELIAAYQKNLAEIDAKPASWSKVYEAVMKTLGEFDPNAQGKGSLHNFDENVLSNIQKIHQLYWEHHKKLNPYAKTYLDFFGSTVKYFELGPNMPGPGLGRMMQDAGRLLAEGATYNTTRVIRVIEAYHQVPTMMGLPLNWTTNATLAFSIRAGLKYQMKSEDNHVHWKGFLQPSAALTFLNRMVLDFPMLTQIGVQANSSAYTSTEFKAQYNSFKGKQTLRFERPSKTQKFLELFRTNQLIKHDRYEDIPDWDFERETASWCTKNDVSSAAGLKFCLAKSYPKVTHRIKPWALMAGWCKWQFLVHPINDNEVHYDIELHQVMKHKAKEFNAKFGIVEKDKEKAARFKAVLDENGKDMKLELKASFMPDFSVSLSRSELTSNKKVSGHKMEAHLKLFKDFKYEMEYATEGKVQKPPSKTSSPSDGNSQTVVNEEKLSIHTPYSAYVWNKTVQKVGENVKADASLTYENLKDKNDWMKDVLPPAFWENDKKASLKMRLHWKKPIHGSEGVVTRQTEFRFLLPRYVMTLSGNGLYSRHRQQMTVNLAKTDINRGKLDAFLNITCDWWTNEDKEQYDKDIGVVNITIPRRSWSVLYQGVREGWKFHHEVTLKRAAMKPKNDLKSDYVGWWSEEVSDRFSVDEKEIKLTADNEWIPSSNEELTSKYSSVTREELEGLESALLTNNIVLSYPLDTETESFVYDGYFIFSSARAKVRYQKNCELTSTYNNLKLTSQSVYKDGSEGMTIDHASHFTHLGTQTKAYNTIRYSSKKVGQCYQKAFKHDIRSPAFDLSTDATHRCEKVQDGLYTLRLTLHTNSSRWNMLDMKLNQIVEDVTREYSREEMTTTHALGTIHVDAEWNTNPEHHQKRVILCSKNGHCPNAELFIENFHDGKKFVKFSLPNRNDTQITYERKLSSNYKNLNIKIGYFNHLDGLSEMLDFTGEILSRNYHVWKGTLNASTYAEVRDLFGSGCEAARSAFLRVAKDPGHPLNEMLRPALKMTLYEYWGSLKIQINTLVYATWDEVFEVFYTIETFAEPAYTVLVNAAMKVHETCRAAYDSLKEKSVLIWAIDYFDLPYYFQQGITYLPHSLSYLWNELTMGEENIMHFKYITGNLLSLSSFRSFPSIDLFPSFLEGFLSPSDTENVEPEYRKLKSGHKLALLFGPRHVYTFDGRLYDAPRYPSEDCLYLVAHDPHASLFTVLSSRNHLHVLFPEMSLSIDDQNRVFVNGSRQPSSLPIQASNGKVTVKRGSVVEVWSPSLSVVCRAEDFLCVLELSGSHSGGVVGLLGNADERSANDYLLPSGNVSSSLLDFAKMYEVSGKPECKNLDEYTVPELSDEARQTCLEQFGYDCMSKTDIRNRFLEVCASDVKEGHGACFAASGFSAMCHLKYMPSHTKCNVRKKEQETIGRNLEVVLIVQESRHLSSADKPGSPAKGIESLIRALDVQFKESGYGSVQYGMVGFGGLGVRSTPTVHSSQKDVWLSGDAAIEDVLKTFEFKGREEADGVEALKYALEEFGHDSFGSKVFVAITAKDKQMSEKRWVKALREKLDRNGITLYVVSSYPSLDKGKKVFGVRADGLLFPSPSKGDEAYLEYPRGGSLAKLAASTRGSVFLARFLRDNQPQAFFEEFAREVWAKVNREAGQCRNCRPVGGEWWWYKNQCFIGHC